MRVVPSALIWFSVGLGVWACTSSVRNSTPEPLEGQTTATTASSTGQAATTSAQGTPVTAASNGGVVNTTGTNGVTSAAVTNGVTNGVTSGVGGATSTAAVTTGAGGTSSECTDLRHPDHLNTECSVVATWNECGNAWLQGYCDLSCGRCTAPTTTSSTSGSTTANVTSDTSATTSAVTSTSTTGQLGNDNPWGEVTNGQSGWASRYWDCCKPSCAWSGNASNPVKSCDVGDNSLGVSDETNACELNGESGAFTCHSMAPWAYSTQVSFGFAAINGVSCGSCFQIQFTGTAQRGGNGPGAAALAGKSMIVMASNIGGIEQGQFDLLIPGGGVGDFNGCSGQWDVGNEELGEQYGGFLSDCVNSNLDTTKNCMRTKCTDIFQSRGLTELYDGCMWFVDWFQAADNPDFTYRQIDCPQELVNAAH